MTMTIGKKLVIGFSLVLSLMAVSAGVAYYKLASLETSVSNAVDR